MLARHAGAIVVCTRLCASAPKSSLSGHFMPTLWTRARAGATFRHPQLSHMQKQDWIVAVRHPPRTAPHRLFKHAVAIRYVNSTQVSLACKLEVGTNHGVKMDDMHNGGLNDVARERITATFFNI